MQSFRSFEFLYLLDKIRCFLKTSIDAGKADICHLVQCSQAIHDHFSNKFTWDFTLKFFRYRRHNVVHQFIH
jgi:hypothetical protein